MTSSGQRSLANEHNREHVEHLLARYPELDADEKAAILRFLKKAPPLEVGLLTSVEAVRPQLDRFRADHAHEFELGWKGVLTAIVIIVALLAICSLLWNIGAGR